MRSGERGGVSPPIPVDGEARFVAGINGLNEETISQRCDVRSSKNSQRITIRGVEYRWRASGNDGYISIGIWPCNNVGSFIYGNIGYHETWIDQGSGVLHSAGNQIIVTNRLIRRIIELAIAEHDYHPEEKAKMLNLAPLDEKIQWDDAVRAGEVSQPSPDVG